MSRDKTSPNQLRKKIARRAGQNIFKHITFLGTERRHANCPAAYKVMSYIHTYIMQSYNIHICINTYIYVCMNACMHVCMYACMHGYIHTFMQTHAYEYLCT